MSRIPLNIRVDPYYDGAAATLPQPGLAAHADSTGNGTGTTTAGANHVSGYRDVRQLTLVDGRPMSAVMRSGTRGLAGTVIPRSRDGVPLGVNPHAVADLTVNIDPHIPGQQSSVRLRDLTPQAFLQARQLAEEATPPPVDMDTARLRAAATMYGLAAVTGGASPASQRAAVAEEQPLHFRASQAAAAPPQGHPRAEPDRPLQAFQQPANSYGREARQISFQGAPTPAPPRVKVTFEIENFGVHTARYLDLVRVPGFIILIGDAAEDEMYAPPAGESAPPMGLQVAGESVVYLVHATGIQYTYGSHQFCVLVVEKEAPWVSAAAPATG